MNRIWRILPGLLILVTASSAQGQRTPGGEVQQLFEEAQRYHLGIDRPINPRRAVKLYYEIIKLDPRHADALYNLAGLCFNQKRYDLAGKYYLEVIKLRPEEGHAYNNLGSVYEKQGKAERAKRLYEKTLSIDPEIGTAYYNLSRLHFAQGDAEKALLLIEKAMDLEPDNTVFVNQHGRIKGELGKLSNKTIGAVVGAFAGLIIVYSLVMRRRRRRARRG